MKKSMLVMGCVWAMSAWAQMTPVGTWHTIDDETHKPKGEVIITENNGVLTGVVGKSLQDDPKAKTICDLCKDDRKDKPIIGMEFVRGLKQEGNKKMQVRGYIGPFYRTQIWLRVQ